MDIRKLLAGVCAFLFIVSGLASLLLVNAERRVFSAETYKRVFERQGLYQDSARIIAGLVMTSTGDSEGVFAMLSALDQAELENVISSLLPPEELEALTDDLFDSTIAFLNGEAETAGISLEPLKRSLTDGGGMRAITLMLQTQPDCSVEQLLLMGMGALSGDEGMTLCKPPEETMGLVQPLIESQLRFTSNSLPDELTFIDSRLNNSSSDLRAQLKKVRTVVKLTPLLPVLFLLALTLLVVRSLGDWLKWWGIPFAITGILGIIVALAAAPIISLVLGSILLQDNPAIPAVILELARDTVDSLAGEILRPVAIQGIVLTLVGVGMFGVNAVINRSRKSV